MAEEISSMSTTVSLNSVAHIRTGFVPRKDPSNSIEQGYHPAFMISPSDFDYLNKLVLLPLFIDGHHIQCLSDIEQKAVASSIADMYSAYLTHVVKHQHIETGSADSDQEPPPHPQISPQQLQLFIKEVKEGYYQEFIKDNLSRLMHDISDHSPPVEHEEIKTENHEFWFKTFTTKPGYFANDYDGYEEYKIRLRRDDSFKKKQDRPKKKVYHKTVGQAYHPLEITYLNSRDLKNHPLCTGDILLISKGNRAGIYLFCHPRYLDSNPTAYSDPIFVANINFLVIRPNGINPASLVSWFSSKDGNKWLKDNNQSALQWRISAKGLSNLEIPKEFTSQHQRVYGENWLRYYHEEITAQFDQEIRLLKYQHDFSQVNAGHNYSVQLYAKSNIRYRLMSMYVLGETKLNRYQQTLEMPTLDGYSSEMYQLGYNLIKSEDTVAALQAKIIELGESKGLTRIEFEDTFIRSILALFSYRSIERSTMGTDWDQTSALWPFLNQVEQTIEQGGFNRNAQTRLPQKDLSDLFGVMDTTESEQESVTDQEVLLIQELTDLVTEKKTWQTKLSSLSQRIKLHSDQSEEESDSQLLNVLLSLLET